MVRTLKIIVVIALMFILGGCSYKVVKNQNNNIENPTINVENNTKIEATIIKVGTFYDGNDGFSLSIPSGNSSVCIWTYAAGSGHIPNLITTKASTATEKHTIPVYGDEEELKVSCVDDFGNQYVGLFPKTE